MLKHIVSYAQFEKSDDKTKMSGSGDGVIHRQTSQRQVNGVHQGDSTRQNFQNDNLATSVAALSGRNPRKHGRKRNLVKHCTPLKLESN